MQFKVLEKQSGEFFFRFSQFVYGIKTFTIKHYCILCETGDHNRCNKSNNVFFFPFLNKYLLCVRISCIEMKRFLCILDVPQLNVKPG